MLMLCFGMAPPAGANDVKDARNEALEISGREPGHPRFLAEPGLLPLGETARRTDRLLDRLREGHLPSHVEDELAVTDGLEGREDAIESLGEPSSDLPHPALLDHPGHAACDGIV